MGYRLKNVRFLLGHPVLLVAQLDIIAELWHWLLATGRIKQSASPHVVMCICLGGCLPVSPAVVSAECVF